MLYVAIAYLFSIATFNCANAYDIIYLGVLGWELLNYQKQFGDRAIGTFTQSAVAFSLAAMDGGLADRFRGIAAKARGLAVGPIREQSGRPPHCPNSL